jgi:hypothetical protein
MPGVARKGVICAGTDTQHKYVTPSRRLAVNARLMVPRAATAGLITVVLLAMSASASQAASSAQFCSSSAGSSTITSNFNGTPIAAGRFIWFSAVLKVSGVPSSGATIRFTNQNISFSANGFTYNTNQASMPAAEVRISPSATKATTTFNESTRTWETVTPPNTAGNIFLSGYAFTQSLFGQGGGLPGGINPVSWSGQFTSSVPGVSINWQWAAAVYTTFSTNNNALGVKPVDDNKASQYQNSDHAGTPENFKQFVIGGARGGGGSNFTGSLSPTASVKPPPCPGLNVFVGYADTVHSPGQVPSPWKGFPNVTFLGDNGKYDAGAVRLDNPTSGSITVSNVTVNSHGHIFSLWGSFSVPAGGSLILTQTANQCPGGASGGCSNFDTSETGNACGTPPATTPPTVAITSGGETVTLADSGHVLDTGGNNDEGCGESNEFHEWVPIGSS